MGERIHKARQLEFKVDQDHLLDVVTLDEMIALSELFAITYELQHNNGTEGINALALLARMSEQIKVGRGMLCKLVWHDDHYLDPVEASLVVGLMTGRQLFDTLAGIMERVNVTGDAEADRASDDAG